MGVGFLFSGAVKSAIKERLKKDGNGIFNDSELELAAKKFEEKCCGEDIDDLRNEQKKKSKAIEIFQRITSENPTEHELMAKIKKLYEIT